MAATQLFLPTQFSASCNTKMQSLWGRMKRRLQLIDKFRGLPVLVSISRECRRDHLLRGCIHTFTFFNITERRQRWSGTWTAERPTLSAIPILSPKYAIIVYLKLYLTGKQGFHWLSSVGLTLTSWILDAFTTLTEKCYTENIPLWKVTKISGKGGWGIVICMKINDRSKFTTLSLANEKIGASL